MSILKEPHKDIIHVTPDQITEFKALIKDTGVPLVTRQKST